MNKDKLVTTLLKEGFNGLFLLGEQPVADSIWKLANIEKELTSIYLDKYVDAEAKFLAAEIMLSKSNETYNEKHKEVFIDLYVNALANSGSNSGTYKLSANLWGFLYVTADTGMLGKRFIQFGKKTIPALLKLLDKTEIILYDGSREATQMNEKYYRIKDFAAFYISKIKNIPMTFYQDFDKRDAEIERLKQLLANEY